MELSSPVKLKEHVKKLAAEPRNYRNLKALDRVADYISDNWKTSGLKTEFQTFKAGKETYKNILTHVGPDSVSRIVIGAHYDVAGDGPGADDNASGIAGLLELGRMLKELEPKLKRRVDLVAYCLEEPPFFGSDEMGSAVHAA